MDYYIPLTSQEISERKLREWTNVSKIINWGRSNPVAFAEMMWGTQLMDFQRWIFMETWTRRYALWLCCRGASKTTLAAIYLMTRLALIPDYHVYVSTTSAQQSIEVFKKVEDIALNRLASFKKVSDLFAREVEKTASNRTGFSHDVMGHTFRLFNNSSFTTLPANAKTIRGKRGAVLFDEVGWQTRELLSVAENFANVDADFSTSTETKRLFDPPAMPLQLLYTSSASDIDYPYYEKYKIFSKNMIMGNPDYFVCNLDANDIIYHTTINGRPVKSHLTEAQITKAMEEDQEKARRELFNEWRQSGGDNAIVKMEVINQHTVVRPPVLHNETGQQKFILCYDPARASDNSIVTVFQVIEDPKDGTKLRLVYMESLVDTKSKNKTPLSMPDQINRIKTLMIAYNGEKAAEWENIELYVDAGAGGGGVGGVGDGLLADWEDFSGRKHRGVVDPEHPQYATARDKYTNAAPVIHLLEPTAYKTKMFAALEKMANLGLIEFPDTDGKNYLIMEDPENKGQSIQYDLDYMERRSLTQCALAKNELVYIVRYENDGGGIKYGLVKDRKNKMHDDRAYTIAMGAYVLMMRRHEDIVKPDQTDMSGMDEALNDKMCFRKPIIRK